MLNTSLDIITRRALLEKGLPLHYYFEYLTHAATCLRELNIDTLQIINYRNLPVNDYYAVDLPEDFMDDVGVCIPIGGLLRPIPKKDNISPMMLIDGETGDFVPYTNNGVLANQSLWGIQPNWIWFWNVNDYGEPTGRNFGANGGDHRSGYTVVKKNRQIQLTQGYPCPNIILIYISDGQSVDSASQVDTMAFSTIRAYQDWAASPYAGIDNSPQGMSFYNRKRTLKGRLNSLTVTDIVEIYRQNYTAAMKS